MKKTTYSQYRMMGPPYRMSAEDYAQYLAADSDYLRDKIEDGAIHAAILEDALTLQEMRRRERAKREQKPDDDIPF